MEQTGGRLLGSGVYGCTFEPAPRCAGGSVFRTISGLPAVGKVTYEDATEELNIGREIMALPLAKQYFSLPTVSCKPEEPVADPDAGRCDAIKTAAEEHTDLDMLIMPLGGIEINKWADDLARLTIYYKRIFIHLLEGALIYQNAGIVHNDIHMGNVVVDEMGVARFIDFGLAFKPAAVRRWEDSGIGINFKPRYMWQAPEIHAARMLFNGMSVAKGSAQLKEQSDIYGRMEKQFPARAPLETAAATIIQEVEMRGPAAYLRRYAKQFDAWRIGLLMWLLWNDMLGWSGFMRTELYRRDREVIRRVLCGLTDFNPRNRLTIIAALRILDERNRLLPKP